MADDAQVPAINDNAGLRAVAGQISIGSTGLAVKTMAELMDFAQLMAKGGPMVGKAFRGQPGACLAITMQAMRWSMDPFAVSQKAYTTKGGDDAVIAYEAQLVAAVINAHAPIKERPRYAFSGENGKRRCTVSATFKGDSEPCEYMSPEIGQITTKNSPLWKTDPDQQLSYYALRSWARRYCPEIVMGVYSVDEMEVAQAVTVERSEPIPVADADSEALLNHSSAHPVEPSEDPGMFIAGEAKELVVNHYTALMKACTSDGALQKVWAKFERIYYNGTTKKVSQPTHYGLECVRDQEEERIGREMADLGRTSEEREDQPEPDEARE